MYRICYLAAANYPELKEMLEKIDSENKNIVQKTLKSNEENIAFLRAIFVREISKKLKQGLTKRQAVKATIEESKRAFTNWDHWWTDWYMRNNHKQLSKSILDSAFLDMNFENFIDSFNGKKIISSIKKEQ